MHKYSYELSQYYRREPSRSHHHSTTANTQRNVGNAKEELSRTMVGRNPYTPQPPPYNKRLNDTKSHPLYSYKPTSTIASLQSRLANLTHLSDRHNQILQESNLNHHKGDTKLYNPQEAPQSSINPSKDIQLKRQFSFNNIPQQNIGFPLKTQQTQHINRVPTAKTPYLSKTPPSSKQGMAVREKAELHLTMANLNRTQPSSKTTPIRKADLPDSRETYNKLSSLQDRIKSTLQPYSHF